MPLANVNGVNLWYEIIGERGPWVVLTPGGRRGGNEIRPVAELIGAAGYRVVIHDRRNCGASDVLIEGEDSEQEIWADELHALLSGLGALPVFAGGASAGCRLALLLALRHPEAVRGLLLWRVTGGTYAAEHLAYNYYGQFIEAARRGGMPAVCETEFFRERIAANPANRERLLAMDTAHFLDVMSRWQDYFLSAGDLPVIGATEDVLHGITVPTCILPGHDNTHPKHVAENLHRLLPNSELHNILSDEDVARQVAAGAEIVHESDEDLAQLYIDFLNKVTAPARV